MADKISMFILQISFTVGYKSILYVQIVFFINYVLDKQSNVLLKYSTLRYLLSGCFNSFKIFLDTSFSWQFLFIVKTNRVGDPSLLCVWRCEQIKLNTNLTFQQRFAITKAVTGHSFIPITRALHWMLLTTVPWPYCTLAQRYEKRSRCSLTFVNYVSAEGNCTTIGQEVGKLAQFGSSAEKPPRPRSVSAGNMLIGFNLLVQLAVECGNNGCGNWWHLNGLEVRMGDWMSREWRLLLHCNRYWLRRIEDRVITFYNPCHWLRQLLYE